MDMLKSDEWVALCYQHFVSESGMVRAAWVQYRAFPQELPPEIFSRDGRLIPLQILDVSASEKRALWRIAGGTAEALPFVPIVG